MVVWAVVRTEVGLIGGSSSQLYKWRTGAADYLMTWIDGVSLQRIELNGSWWSTDRPIKVVAKAWWCVETLN